MRKEDARIGKTNEKLFESFKELLREKKFEDITVNDICDHECVWTFTVTDRTEKTITVTDGAKTKKLRIIQGLSEWSGTESCYPLGKYSMAPILRA